MYTKKTKLARQDGGEPFCGYKETDPNGRYGRLEEILGKGATKTVYKAIDEVLGVEVAWNQVKLNEVVNKPEDLQRLYSEVHLLSTFNHDNIVRFYTSWIDIDHKTFNFVTEMFTSGTLREYRGKYNQVSIRAIKCWARQILEGIVYLHGHDPPVIHRDLKCDNIFVNGHLGQVKIGDLGLAAILRGSHSAHSVIGTPEFMAPEMYDEEYNELVDVYSFGMCILEMLTSEFPYGECTNPAQIYKKVTSGKLPAAFYRLDDLDAQKFIGKCLVKAADRPSAKALLLDPFLSPDDALAMARIGIEKPFLNEEEMGKLNLGEYSPRTQMTIIGKLNPDDGAIFLKVQITDKDGSRRNIYFPFDIFNDTPIDVAMEMVRELELTDWEPFEIANMIEEEVSALLPDRRKTDHPKPHHMFNYQEGVDSEPYHRICSFSSSSTSKESLLGSTRSFHMTEGSTDGYHWLRDDVLDDPSSSSSYSNMNFLSEDESLVNATKRDKLPPNKGLKCTRFSAGNCLEQCGMLVRSQASAPTITKMAADRFTRNRSLVDLQSQLLHRSLVEEINKRRRFNTVGSVENIGFQSPSEVSRKISQPVAGIHGRTPQVLLKDRELHTNLTLRK